MFINPRTNFKSRYLHLIDEKTKKQLVTKETTSKWQNQICFDSTKPLLFLQSYATWQYFLLGRHLNYVQYSAVISPQWFTVHIGDFHMEIYLYTRFPDVEILV